MFQWGRTDGKASLLLHIYICKDLKLLFVIFRCCSFTREDDIMLTQFFFKGFKPPTVKHLGRPVLRYTPFLPQAMFHGLSQSIADKLIETLQSFIAFTI